MMPMDQSPADLAELADLANLANLAGADDPNAWLDLLQAWCGPGWLRLLDVALARFVAQHDPAPSPLLLLATAVLSQAEAQGHACLPLDALAADAPGLLAWGTDAADAWALLVARLPPPAAWPALLAASPLVGSGSDDAGQPLVLDLGGPSMHAPPRLYLRRYWQCEQRLARQVLLRGQADADALLPDPARVRVWLDRLFPPAVVVAAAADASAQGITSTALPPPFDWQKAACAIALRGRLTVITGGPGTGKTYTAARLLALLLALADAPEHLRIALAAPTGKAAARLRQAIDAALAGLRQRLGDVLPWGLLADQLAHARTLHGLLGARPDTRHLRHGPARPLEVDVVIVDEASMVHLEMMAALLDALPPTCRLVLLGDKDQLASVEAGAVLADLCQGAQAGRYRPETAAWLAACTGQPLPALSEAAGDAEGLDPPADLADANGPPLAQQTVMLRRSQRFGGAIGRLARAVNAGDAAGAQALLQADAGSAVAWLSQATPAAVAALAVDGRSGAEGGYRACLSLLAQRPPHGASPAARAARADQLAWVAALLQGFEQFRVLCALREGDWGVAGLNRAIESRLAQAGLLRPQADWYEGRPVIVTRNDADLGVFNGDIGLALRAGGNAGGDAGGLRVWFADGTALRSVSTSRLPAVQTAFAMTVHKAQGSEFAHTVLVLPPETARGASRELIYTGITRARSALTLVSARPDLLAQGLARRTRRSSGLAGLLGG